MSVRKQQLLKQHRRNKRVAMLVILAGLVLLSLTAPLWVLPLVLVVLWVVHEAWFADHLFYAPQDDYQYRFPEAIEPYELLIVDGRLTLDPSTEVDLEQSTLIAKVQINSSWLGRWFDPGVLLGNDQQTFERAAQGIRYLNLTGQAAALLAEGLRIRGRFCTLANTVQLYVFDQPRPVAENIVILAPHADDAELAAFGLYSSADKVSIITLTQGEIEAEHYQRLGLSAQQAAQLKGRLRSWDSMAIPLWGGVPQANCVQLGYYCMQLPVMAQQPDVAFGSKQSGETDIRSAREHNCIKLPADNNGAPTWTNLVA